MHEATLAAGVLKIAAQAAGEQSEKVKTVVVAVGELAGVMTDSLIFAFDALKSGTGLKNASIKIESGPVTALCEECSREYSPRVFPFVCPLCGCKRFKITGGEEVFVKELEVEAWQ